MLDNPQKWSPTPDWTTASLEGDGFSIRTLHGLTQCLVSGDLGAFSNKHGLDLGVGALGVVRGDRYAVRMARDRLSAFGLSEEEMGAGWHQDGYAVTQMSAALHIFEFSGPQVLQLVARATTIDPRNPGPCAAVQFAGITSCLYFHESRERLRLHLDRGLAAYMWLWLKQQISFR
ncbi:sarcosine oxidase subunit gamma family protein [Mesorhizobium sp. B2-4-17]|uniref:sarcosine oxidase subunit gamma family protein n=1 Tax=Mesorhizobium sp. B2-4-17 TaxID=2589932 RepID=UPI001129E7F6|nr:sarcosine oxidase subunit gamma family protein [Mesorhizobium sp. B2-4-17]TPK91515.1 hypothetical protein FJ548_04550 [Mesorhizobium sp. B2-4-17]